ncbi:15-cis-zeta-carotene isomerase, chloroplastic [Porphyridium purpureum]|uniref:15-cis-zeta-carotene isomerase, chloroplastic n=1 Tax=Porphyridium purpureum TaxID=35688 RepID=A0A5J4YI73_PORPP|nr:15-cis-zeta-carotene isomerase, chloroplastic [Porphyridium purpureum]|eukprot:POR5982..scf270_19
MQSRDCGMAAFAGYYWSAASGSRTCLRRHVKVCERLVACAPRVARRSISDTVGKASRRTHGGTRFVVPRATTSEAGTDVPPSGSGDYMAERRLALGAAIACEILGFGIPLLAAIADASASGQDGNTLMHLLQTKYSTHFAMMLLLNGFAVIHSGLAALRPRVAQLVGERIYRVIFALCSLPAAGYVIAFYIAHRYDGMQLWTIQGVPGVHDAVYVLTFVSFLFLYPATFNLLEVAAVQKPGFRIYETGITRITRHPQLWGQLMWCVAHCAWTGTTLPLVASAGLLAHHFLGAWHGDVRLQNTYKQAWEQYAVRTSLLPFAAVVRGDQTIQWREFVRPAYIGVIAFTLGAYAAHPAMLRLIGELHL